MTKVQNPIIGRAKGSAGGMTFSKNSDQNVMRAKAFEVNNPKTQAQQIQRTYFAAVNALVSTFSPEQLRTLFPTKPKKMSRRNALSKQLSTMYTNDTNSKEIAWDEIDTLGNASTMDFGETSVTYSDSNIVVVLDNAVKNNTEFADNQFIAALVNGNKGEILLAAVSAKVSVGTITIPAPNSWETTDVINAIPLITDHKDGNIALVGFGTMGVTKRPHKG